MTPMFKQLITVLRAHGFAAGFVFLGVFALVADALTPGGPEGVPYSDLGRGVADSRDAGTTPGVRLGAGLSVTAVEKRFDQHGYRLERVIEHGLVPPVYLAALPGDLPEIENVDRKKRVFLRTMLPLILKTNQRIAIDRERLLDIAERHRDGDTLGTGDRAWLHALSVRYKVDLTAEDAADDGTDGAAAIRPGALDTLTHRVDVISPALALAQAAEESGWGTSRFAQQGNALFGQWVWDKDAPGIVPKGRKAGMTHRIRAFDQLQHAVAAYALNLNTHNAYKRFRAERAAMAARGEAPDGYALTATLDKYSERGWKYVETLRIIMRANDLMAYDPAQLSNSVALR